VATRGKRLIPGTPLLGFLEAFEEAAGRPTRNPPRVTPTCIGGVLAPFACPHCGAVRSEPIDKKKRAHYADESRGFSFCPACRGRYVIDWKGMPLAESLPAGAVCAPAKVERGGKVEVLRGPSSGGSGLDLLGAAWASH
jgi:hypothetical protein